MHGYISKTCHQRGDISLLISNATLKHRYHNHSITSIKHYLRHHTDFHKYLTTILWKINPNQTQGGKIIKRIALFPSGPQIFH